MYRFKNTNDSLISLFIGEFQWLIVCLKGIIACLKGIIACLTGIIAFLIGIKACLTGIAVSVWLHRKQAYRLLHLLERVTWFSSTQLPVEEWVF